MKHTVGKNMESTNLKIKVLDLIYDAIDDFQLSSGSNKVISKSPETILYGNIDGLDSLGLVNLIVNIEQKVQDDFGISIAIADEKALSAKNSPFRNVETLADYVHVLIKGQ